MNTGVRAVVDEGISPRISEALRQVVALRKPPSEVTHLFALAGRGAPKSEAAGRLRAGRFRTWI